MDVEEAKGTSVGTAGQDLSVIQVLVDQLVTLSSYNIINIRDSATEAAVAIGKTVARDLLGRREMILQQRRLMEAEASKGSRAKPTTRYSHLMTTIKRMEQCLKSLDVITKTVFDGCLVVRLKDTHERMRAACLSHLGHWVQIDPEKYMRDEYLKYLGWSLNDDNNEVRRAVIGALHRILDCTEHTAKLHTFAARFADPLATLAALDKDAVMNHQVVLLLQKLDKEGLLDTVSEEVLDLVDRIVFDLDIAEETRSEALVFFMNHTEGFEVDEEAEEKVAAVRASDAKKSTKRGKSRTKATDKDAQLQFQRAANQLETLCEFVELHESEQYRSKTKMLVEACLLVEDSRRLLTVNWSVIISLLLKESDGLDQLDATSSLGEYIALFLRELCRHPPHGDEWRNRCDA